MKKQNSSVKLASMCLLSIIPCLVFTLSLTAAETGAVYFQDDFNSGSLGTNWDVAGDSWQATDLFYRSPGFCASDSPKGNYPWSANSTMTMRLAQRVDLSKSTHPVLRFWHRIGVHSGDYGYVEISEDYGFTWKVLTSYTNTWRSTWSFEQIDLSPYKTATKPILMRFRLRDNGDGSTTWGWDIDDVEIRERDTETIPFPFFDDFESGTGNFMLQAGDAWQRTENWSVSPTRAVSETPDGNYSWAACSDLILAHPIDLSSAAWPVLTFWHRIGVHSGDYGYVDISEDFGCTWKTLAYYTNVWLSTGTYEKIDLSAYRSRPILIRFRLRDNGDGSTTWGWDIDDVAVRELFYPTTDTLPDSLIVQITEVDNSRCPVVRATVTVADVNGAAVIGLSASNFSVYDDPDPNSNPRPLLGVEPNLPISHVCLALDYSGSMVAANAIGNMETAAKAFIDLLGLGDWGEVIKFANGVEVTQGYTNDKSALKAAIDRPIGCKDTATWLYDAIYQAVSDAAAQPRKKAVVVMTDGRDTKSPPGRSATEVINHARAKGVPVFTIGLGAEIDEQVLIMIAQQTGGVYYPAGTSSDLLAIYQKIAGTIKNQYIVTYESAVCQPSDTESQEHEVKIVVEDGTAYGLGTKRFK